MAIIPLWVGGFMGQLIIVILAVWALHKCGRRPDLALIVAAVCVFSATTAALSGGFSPAEALVVYLPSGLAVFQVLKMAGERRRIH